MSHLFTREYWENEASGTAKGERHWTRQFKVAYDTLEHSATVLDSPGLPLRWEAHPLDSRMTAQDATAKNLQGDPFVWIVEVQYSSLTDTEDRGADDPRDRPTDVETDFIAYQVPMHHDKDKNAVLNSAGDPFDPSWQMEDSRPVLRFRRFEDDFDFDRSLAYRNAINTDAFFGLAPGEVMCMYIKQRRHFENGIECWDTAYEFQGKANDTVTSNNIPLAFKGWDAVIPDVGFNEVIGGTRRLIRDEGSPPRPVSSPVRLNGFGQALLASAPIEVTTFLVFRPPYRYLAFAALSLP